jgi:hypothetical protein
MISNSTLLAAAIADSPLEGLGLEVHRCKNMMKVIYDFSVLGGAIGDIFLLDDQGNKAILPTGAIVTNTVCNVITAVTSAGSATVALKLLNSADLMGATAKASLASGFVAGVPVGTAATWVGPVTAQAGTQVKATVAVAALTAGKLQFFIEYVIQ